MRSGRRSGGRGSGKVLLLVRRRAVLVSTVPQKGKGMSAPRRPQGSTGGFTLVELMLVVAVMSIIMAMAIPSFLNTRIAANESSAIATMRAVVTSNEQYRTRFQSYASALTDLWAEGYIDATVANPFKAGYTF